ncbi:globin domain-containing protein [Actinocatenispora rupis]|uniref:nitric oxide dioxygenase n=1 Tax=Actinocatenispora rupis TaxID=519421 RepID=A0A8J3J235_9ACTN|nr:globin domain-containing protein [Actinocatenispora rupis]GID10592.1 flavohemoprotein [Actinocatenispora rupis]
MDPRALKESWAALARHGDEVPLFFYSHLFLACPETRGMFPMSMAGQRDKLVGALGRIVSNVDQLDEVVPFVQQLGRDHRRFAVVAEHYPAVGASLLATLAHFLGRAWTDDLAAQWAEAYGLVAKVMTDAAEEAAATRPAWWNGEITAVDRRGIDVAVLQVRTDVPYPFAPGQSAAVEFARRPRLWRWLTPANAPRSDGSLELHVKIVDGGQVSPALVQSAAVGDTLRIGAPVGDRLVLPADERDLLMVAGATGLAPLRAVLEQIDRDWQSNRAQRRVHLFHGARTGWDLYENDLLSELAAARAWFEYTPVVSDDPFFRGERGLVGETAVRAGRWTDRDCLVCGPPAMVEHTVAQLATAGVPDERVRFDEFTPGAAAEPVPVAPDGGERWGR